MSVLDRSAWINTKAAYYGSPERATVDPELDPAQYIAKTERWFIDPVLPAELASE